MKKIIYIFIVVIVALYSCSDPYADNSFIKDESALPAASYMEQADSLKVSMWVDLLKYTSMFNTMNLSADYTHIETFNESACSIYDAAGSALSSFIKELSA
jgi:hypothetical protein